MSMTPLPMRIVLVVAANAAIGTTASRTSRLSACHTASNACSSAYRTSSIPCWIGCASCRYSATGTFIAAW
jgi:hypothetical protein